MVKLTRTIHVIVLQIDFLGFIAHSEKSVFNASQQLAILRFVLNSVTMTVTLTREKALALQHACQVLLDTVLPTIREVASVLGKTVSSFPGVMYSPLHYHHIKQDKIHALQNYQCHFQKHMSLSQRAKFKLE